MPERPYDYTPYAFETVTVPSANVAGTLTATVYNTAPVKRALVTIGTGPIVSYQMGTAVSVTSQTGHHITQYGFVYLDGVQQIRDFSFTSVSSATTATLRATYFR